MLTTSIVNEREWCTELNTCSFQFSPKTRKTMPLYAYLTPKVDFKRKFNHHKSFPYEWRLTARTIRKFWNRTITTNRISNRTYDSKSNRIKKLRRSLLYTHSCFYAAGSTQHPQPVMSTSNTMRVEYSVADAGQPQEGDEDGGFVALFEAVCKYSSSVFKSNQSINQSVY